MSKIFNKNINIIYNTGGSLQLSSNTNTIGNVIFTTGGNVGIGTTAPSFPLHVVINSDASLGMGLNNDHTGGNSRINFNLTVGAASSGNAGQIYASISDPTFTMRSYSGNTSGVALLTGGAAPIRFSTQATERMRIATSGNVGIGTTVPSSILHVFLDSTSGNYNTTSNSTLRLQRKVASYSGTDTATSLAFESMWTGNSATYSHARIRGIINNSSGDGDLGFDTASGYNGYSEKMRITNTGNVGIGTMSPTDLLHMTGGSISISTDNATSRGILFNQNAVWGGIDLEGIGNIPGSQIVNIGINSNRSKTWNSSYAGGFFRIDTRGGSGIPLFQWFKKDATGGTESMMACLTSTGNFGIGTSTPDTLLHVAGAIKAGGNTGFRVNVITGTFPASGGHNIALPSGVTRDQIIFFWGQTQNTNGDWVPWDYRGDNNWFVSSYLSTSFFVTGPTGNTFSKPYKLIVMSI